MAKQKKGNTPARAAVRHHEKAPCAQGFNVGAKPGKKSRSWWNGHSSKPAQKEAA